MFSNTACNLCTTNLPFLAVLLLNSLSRDVLNVEFDNLSIHAPYGVHITHEFAIKILVITTLQVHTYIYMNGNSVREKQSSALFRTALDRSLV